MGTEPESELCSGGRGLLQHVVQQARRDDLVWLTVITQQAAHLNRMGNERRVVDLPVMIRVPGGGELERSLRQRYPGELVGRATR